METKKARKSPVEFHCELCNFKCSHKRDYNRHLSTAKHKWKSDGNNGNKKSAQVFQCDICDKRFKTNSGLWKHAQKCRQTMMNVVVSTTNESSDIDKRDEIIERLVSSSDEMKTMFQLLLEKYHESQIQNQELMNKMIDVIPQIGNTTNNNNSNNTTNNNTLNFYLTNTCKDAETIHDFTERFVQRSVDFFKGNFLDVAHNKIDLASNVYEIFKKCLDENPQTRKFVQTTDIKNGIVYIKEKPKDANKQLYGDAEFIKYMDGFEKAGTNISHAINCAFVPIQTDFQEILEKECGKKPCEEDYEDEDQYEKDMDRYKEKTGDLKLHLLIQSLNTVCLFDTKKRRNEVLEKTRRLKE